jgi:hypothetical protein
VSVALLSSDGVRYVAELRPCFAAGHGPSRKAEGQSQPEAPAAGPVAPAPAEARSADGQPPPMELPPMPEGGSVAPSHRATVCLSGHSLAWRVGCRDGCLKLSVYLPTHSHGALGAALGA